MRKKRNCWTSSGKNTKAERSHEPDPEDRAGRNPAAQAHHSGFLARRYRHRQRERGGRRKKARAGVRGHGNCEAQSRPQLFLHRAQDLLRRGRGAHVPDLLAAHSLRRGEAQRRSAPRQALLPAQPLRQIGADPRENRRSRRENRRCGVRAAGVKRNKIGACAAKPPPSPPSPRSSRKSAQDTLWFWWMTRTARTRATSCSPPSSSPRKRSTSSPSTVAASSACRSPRNGPSASA